MSISVLVCAGCGGGSHAAGPAAASVTPSSVAGVSSTSTTGTADTSTSASGGHSVTTSTASSTSSTSAQGNPVSGADASSAAGKSGTNAPVLSRGGSGAGKGSSQGKRAGKTKTKSKGKAVAGSGAGVASPSAGGSGAAGSTGSSSAPNANTGVPFEVNTTSMEPTFQPETKIYYDPTRTQPQIGEVVVFYLPAGAEESACGEVMTGGRACSMPVPGTTKNKEISFKRVVGLPGDSIAVREGHVIRNGQAEPEPQTLPCEKDEKLNCEFPTPITVPAGHYYLMADNRGLYKEDSRILGAIPQEYILGTVEGPLGSLGGG